MNAITPKRPAMSNAERARRKKNVNSARASVRLEGLVISPFAEDMYSRYINGEFTAKEVAGKIRAHHQP